MAENKDSELKTSIEKYDMVRLLLDYNLHGMKPFDAARRIATPTVKDRIDACRFSVENFDAEMMDVIIASVACTTLRFGLWVEGEDGTPALKEDIPLNPSWVIDNFDYSDLVRLNALMGKGIKHPMEKDQITAMIDEHEIVPLHQPYTLNGNTFNAAVRHRRALVRDHISARSYSMDHWRYSFNDAIVAGTAANTMTFGTLNTSGEKPFLTNQTSIDIEFIVGKFLYPDLVLLDRLLGKTPASSASKVKP